MIFSSKQAFLYIFLIKENKDFFFSGSIDAMLRIRSVQHLINCTSPNLELFCLYAFLHVSSQVLLVPSLPSESGLSHWLYSGCEALQGLDHFSWSLVIFSSKDLCSQGNLFHHAFFFRGEGGCIWFLSTNLQRVFFSKENFVNQNVIICEPVKRTSASGCLGGEKI